MVSSSTYRPAVTVYQYPVRIAGRQTVVTVREEAMDEHIYRVIQLVGSSDQSIDDAIQRAVSRASKNLRNLRWFEVVETRGNIDDGKLSYQVTLKVGFTMEG
jgi:flavin-binding protein dodecin